MNRLHALRKRALLPFVFAITWLATGEARADLIDPFVGEYVGRAVDGDMDPRDASVTISKDGDGFVIQWTTVSHRGDGKASRKSYTVRFQPTPREGIFASAMKRDKFGARVPLDPLEGDPYVWAKIDGATLTVYALLITDDGGFEMQSYRRTLTPTGLDLHFTRIREGETLKTISASLARAKH